MRRVRGFTLLELMVVVTVIAILAGIAITSYTKQIRKSRRAQAVQVLSDLSLRQEKWRTNNAEFADIGDLDPSGKLTDSDTSPWYSFEASDLSGTTYTFVATPRSGTDQEKDTCGAFTFAMEEGTLTKSAEGGSSCF
jgi:type IV pilus assembly protein PilE